MMRINTTVFGRILDFEFRLSRCLTMASDKLHFSLLPDYAAFILRERLDEFVGLIIHLSREEELPLLEPLSKYTEEELTGLSIASYREILTALSENSISAYIHKNVEKWIANQLMVIDRHEISAEDITLGSFIKRKAFNHFIHCYAGDASVSQKLSEEIDVYTTREELLSYNAYIKIQQEKMSKNNQDLIFQETLLLEAQEIAEFGSYLIDYEDPKRSVLTPQVARITGLPDFTSADGFFEQVPIADQERIKKTWEAAFQKGGDFDFEFSYMLDGNERRLRSAGLITVENGVPKNLRGTLKDITKEYVLIQKLKESEALYKQAQKLTHIGNWSWDIASNVVSWSDEMYQIYGLEPQSETIDFQRFLSLIHPDDREKRIREINESLQTLEAPDYTLKIQNPDGAIKILKGRGKVETDGCSNPVRLVGTCQDITKEYHLNKQLVDLNDSLYQKNLELEKINKELESFNYIASHDLQEPLRKIQIFADRVLEYSDHLPQVARNSMDRILSSAARLQRLIIDLIEFSQISSPAQAFELVDLNEIVEDVKADLHVAGENDDIVFISDELPRANVIPFQFTQLFTNIIGNSVKYRKANEILEIRIENQIVPGSEIGESGAGFSGNYLKICISDNGIGFDPAQRNNIFDLFKRLHTKEKYSGTGIGLPICKKIVLNHNGFIKADSGKGGGACFSVYLPESRLATGARV